MFNYERKNFFGLCAILDKKLLHVFAIMTMFPFCKTCCCPKSRKRSHKCDKLSFFFLFKIASSDVIFSHLLELCLTS